jgi:hypothetical protein
MNERYDRHNNTALAPCRLTTTTIPQRIFSNGSFPSVLFFFYRIIISCLNSTCSENRMHGILSIASVTRRDPKFVDRARVETRSV